MQKIKKWRSKEYLAYIRTQACSHCMNPDTVAHHIIGMGFGAMGSKASDFDSFALCVSCHSLIHQDNSAFNQLLYLHRTKDRAFNDGIVKIKFID